MLPDKILLVRVPSPLLSTGCESACWAATTGIPASAEMAAGLKKDLLL
jgi:hypothetical protein